MIETGNHAASIRRGQANRRRGRSDAGFILIVVVGMLAVLVVLGLSYAEQGRVALQGASNTRDLAALDQLSEAGFQLALRALHDDLNVSSKDVLPAHLSTLGGSGWTSRWGYNPDQGLGGSMPIGPDRAPSRSEAYNYQDTWRMLFWNEETVEPIATWRGNAWGYGFKFRPGNDDQAKRSEETQRFPQPSTVLLDTVQLQPLARVRKFRIQVGSNFGLIQVGISPKDGGLNLNDVFDPGTVNENPGVYETLPSGSLEGTQGIGGNWDITTKPYVKAKVPLASPDRRTLEYILGKVPQMAQKSKESIDSRSEWAFRRGLTGSTKFDNGLFNWRHFFEPYGGGRTFGARPWINDGIPGTGAMTRSSTGLMTSMTTGAPTTIYNMAGGVEPNRYGLECTRHVMWAALKGMAFTADGYYGYPGQGFLVAKGHYGNNEGKDYLWFPTGLWTNDARLPATDMGTLSEPAWGGGDSNWYFHGADNQFHGFGFDRFNPHRAGIDAIQADLYFRGKFIYIGAGAYGHPKSRTFQLHFINAAANGRFWTDLLAAWYFGGAPGYTNFLGVTQGSGYNNWAHLGSSYDSIGVGSHWMPPTSHVWLPGFFAGGQISSPGNWQKSWGGDIGGPTTGRDEVSRGMARWPGNMPPARMAATYVVPMARWPADFVGQSNAHFSFNNFRLSIRAHGLQENWGDPDAPGTFNAGAVKNRWYDAIDVNNTNFPVVYGLLIPEKIPSMMNRTAVAPHLHWKARMLDVECRLKRPVKIDGSAEPYDDVKNSWIPVQIGLHTPDAGKTYPGADWDADPDSGSYNPWIPLRMKLNNPKKPWNPDSASADYNIWVEPKLLHSGQPYDAITNPFYNSAAFLAELNTTAAVRQDFIKYPWMPSLKDPVTVVGGVDHIKYGMYGFDNPDLLAYVAAGNTDWSQWIESEAAAPGSVSIANFPFMPIDIYGAAPTWKEPGPFDGAAAYPSPGWDGYLFEPRWYTGRTVNPKFLDDKHTNGQLASVSAYFGSPGHSGGGGSNTLHSIAEPANYWDFTATTGLEGGLGALTGHRHVDPNRPNVVWGKMDFLTPEPETYYDLDGDLLGYGTGRQQDDVYVDCHFDRSLTSGDTGVGRNRQQYEAMMARPDSYRNWHDWFNQRKRTIPADPGSIDRTVPNLFKPDDNDINGTLSYDYVDPRWGPGSSRLTEGKLFENWNSSTGVSAGDPEYTPGPPIRRVVRGETAYWKPDVIPHSQHGIPNPDYLQNLPGYPVSQHWVDQFRRYFPCQIAEVDSPGDPYDDPDDNADTMHDNPYPGAMSPARKMVDDPELDGPAASHTAINPAIPVPRATVGNATTPVVPAVSKDEAWRVTRVGQRYQETIANEIMDYQINPWWPNPCVPVTELCVPLDKNTYPSEPRAKVKVETLTGRNRWRSYAEHMPGNENTIGCRVPKYYAYFNRFWTRTNHRAKRGWLGDPNDPTRPLGEPYRAITIKGNALAGIPDELINATEGKGMYPPTWQYFGQFPPAEATFQDRIKDFPYNAMEDQLGDDWRYISKSVVLMTEPQMQKAPGRNHPFRNWADFVAFLGHLVYRSPIVPSGTPDLALANSKAIRSQLDGVDAYAVCHGANADSRNQGKFFDGSRIRNGFGGSVYADSLRSPIVAKEGYWPIAANYGRAPDSGSDPYYPNLPVSGGWTSGEWKRRWDEIRGRDEAGLRVEHHYISEKAANDVLVSFSNGMVGPVDFDGDGHVTMTRGKGSVVQTATPTVMGTESANVEPSGDIPQGAYFDGWDVFRYKQWLLPAGYPWHGNAGADAVVEYENPMVVNPAFWHRVADSTTLDPLNLKLGIMGKPVVESWVSAAREEIIRNCVTLPIKFHSNTFRITVAVELTDANYEDVYASRRYQKIVSRVPDTTAAKVHGPLTGEFIEHSSRTMSGVDPELNWLGVK